MSVGTVLGYTQNFRLVLINPNARGFGDEEHANLKVIDSALFAATGLSGILGVWENSTAYVIGNRVTDTADGLIYQCEVAHTSAATGLFSADRTANPTYWNVILNAPVFRGVWATGIKYNANDFILDNNRYAVCSVTHTSTTSFDTDIANWDILIDVSTFSSSALIQTTAPELTLEDTDAGAGDDFASYKLDANVATLFGTANGVLKFAGYGDVNLSTFDVKWGGSYQAIWHAGNDGAASGLDADLLDGVQGSGYELALGYTPVNDAGDTMTGQLTLPGAGTGLNAETVSGAAAQLAVHTALTNNPHTVTAAQAAAVATADKSSQAEAEAGTDNTKWMTPLRTAQAIAALGLQANELFHIRDEKAAGTAGGGFTLGAMRTRDLNVSVQNEITGASLAANQFILPAGDYYIEAVVPAGKVEGHKAKLRNITDTADTIIGTVGTSPTSTDSGDSASLIYGKFTIGGAKTFEIQHECTTTKATDGFGQPASFSVVEVYTEVRIWKLDTGGAGNGAFKSARVYQSVATLNIPTAGVVIGFNETAHDVGDLHSESVNNSRITVDEAGYYEIVAQLSMADLALYTRVDLNLRIDGTTIIASEVKQTDPAATQQPSRQIHSGTIFMASGTYVEFLVGVIPDALHDSATGAGFTWMSLRKVG